MKINIVYSYLAIADNRKEEWDRHEIIHSSTPIPGADIYAYLNLSSFRGSMEKSLNMLIMEEPEVVEPQQYNMEYLKWFDHVFTCHDHFCTIDPEHFTYIPTWRAVGDNPVITESMTERDKVYPLANRKKAIVMIAGNKTSPVPTELYSKRLRAAQWWDGNSNMPFDVFGSPPFDLPNYKGIVPPGGAPRLQKFAEYRYAWCFENTDHPEYSKGYCQKIPDCLEARTVPIYYGCANIEQYIPKECLIDFRDFSNYEELDKFLNNMSDERYLEYVKAIDEFVCSGGLRKYTWTEVYKIICHQVLGKKDDNIETDGELDVIKKYIHDGNVVFDVGAERGTWTKWVRESHRNCHVYAFEPDTKNNNPDAFPFALSDHVGTEQYHVTSKSLHNILIKPEAETSYPVPITTVDRFCEEHKINHIDFMKIDVEGGEFNVIKGAHQMIREGLVENIQFEYGGTYPPAKLTLQRVVRYLRQYGYEIFKVAPDSVIPVNGLVEDYGYANYLATKGGRVMSNKTVCVVFSKDRAMQLDATLNSLYRHCKDADTMDVKVLVKASTPTYNKGYEQLVSDYPQVTWVVEKEFQTDLVNAVEDYEYVMFLTDDTVFVKDCTIESIPSMFNDNIGILGFSFRLGENITHCYMLDIEQEPTRYWGDGTGDFGYPLELSSSIYRVFDMLPLLKEPIYNNPNTLEAWLDHSKGWFKETKPALSFYDVSVAFAIPMNRVQTTYPSNRSGTDPRYSVEHLQELFDKGVRVNVRALDNFVPTGVHQEIDVPFVDSQGSDYREERELEVSILMLNYNGGTNVAKCIDSIFRTVGNHEYELIIWDNCSTDGSLEFLKSVESTNKHVRIMESYENIGVEARAKLMPLAKGKYIVVMDNDVVLTRYWLDQCIIWAKAIPDLGIIGPRTNYASGPQLVENAPNHNGDIEGLEKFAENWRMLPEHRGQLLQIPRLPSFFWFMTREVINRVGNFKSYGKFSFEDECFSLRVSLAGLRVLIDNDIYVHHFGGPQGKGDKEYNRLMAEGWVLFKQEWHLPSDWVYGNQDHISYIMEHTKFNKEEHYVPMEASLT